MLNHLSLHSSHKKAMLIGIAILSLLILTTSTAFASGEVDEIQSCSIVMSSGLAFVSDFVGIGAETDTRLMSELERSKCSTEELASRITSGELKGYSLYLVLASSQGLAQDIRLQQELGSALEVVKELSVPGRFGYYNIWW
jgi:hypothetical protein